MTYTGAHHQRCSGIPFGELSCLHIQPMLAQQFDNFNVSLDQPEAGRTHLAPQTPVSLCHLQVLWIISFEWLRWTLILVAILISGSVLVLTFWPVVRDDTKVMAVATIAAIVALHTLLAIGCKVSELAMRQLFTFDNNQKLNCLFFLFFFSLSFQLYFFQTATHIPAPPPTISPVHTNLTTQHH